MEDVRDQEEAGNLEGNGRLRQRQGIAQDLNHLRSCSEVGGEEGGQQVSRRKSPSPQRLVRPGGDEGGGGQ